jgi:hypothetical protein
VKKLDRIARGVMLQSLHQYVWFQRFPETLPESLAVNREVMRRFRDMCRREAIDLTYMIIPTKISIEADELQDTFKALSSVDPALSTARVAEFEDSLIARTLADASELGVKAIDLRPELKARRNGRRLYYPQDLHLNVTGNRVVAETIASHWKGTTEAVNPTVETRLVDVSRIK